jgi:hypothetical protein
LVRTWHLWHLCHDLLLLLLQVHLLTLLVVLSIIMVFFVLLFLIVAVRGAFQGEGLAPLVEASNAAFVVLRVAVVMKLGDRDVVFIAAGEC